MKRVYLQLALAAAVLSIGAGSDWLHFRGTENRSISDAGNLPASFSDGENVAWKAPPRALLPSPRPTKSLQSGYVSTWPGASRKRHRNWIRYGTTARSEVASPWLAA